MKHIYVIFGLIALLAVLSVALAFTSMQLQSLVSEVESFKEKAIKANDRLKQQNEQLRYQLEGLIARMQSGSSSSLKNPGLDYVQEIPMITIAKGRLSGVMEQKNLVIRSHDQFTQIWNEIYSGRPSKPPVPEIDFASATVLATFNGEKPNACHDIMIKKVEVRSDEHLGNENVVTVARIEPGEGAVCEEIPTRAYHIVGIPFTSDEISFIEIVEERDQ